LLRTSVRRAAVLVGAFMVAGSLFAIPASAEPGFEPDLRIALSFDDHAYLTDEAVSVKVTVTNAAVGPPGYANGVRITFESVSGSPVWLMGTDPCCLDNISLAPGDSWAVTMTLALTEWRGSDPVLQFGATAPGETNPDDNQQKLNIHFIPPDKTGSAAGLLYADRDNNGQPGAGEPLAGATAVLSSPRDSFTARADDAGRVTFDQIPVGLYDLAIKDAPDGWIGPDRVPVRVVGAGAGDDVVVRAVRPVNQVVEATGEFNQATYKAGERAVLKVQLASKADLIGVKAFCQVNDFLLTKFDAGQLSPSGLGVTLVAGDTKEFEISAEVSSRAVGAGYIYLSCAFGDDPAYSYGFPTLYVNASVKA
jgi:hypothetical protein